MFLYPYISLFFLTLTTSIFIALSSANWLIIWISLEINIISFIPLISSTRWHQESESALKYLLFQALGSSFILARTLSPSLSLMCFVGLCMKLGAAPFHFWFPSVIKSIRWPIALILITLQKIRPMVLIISSFNKNQSILCTVGILCALVGGFGGIAQSHFRALLAYSSISHIGWIIATCTFSQAAALIYLTIYIAISAPTVWSASLSNINSLRQPTKPSRPPLLALTLPCVLSLSGLPPFAGFLPKLLALSSFNQLLTPLFLLLGSLLNLGYYLNFIFCMFLSSPKRNLELTPKNSSIFLSLVAMIAVNPLPVVAIFLLF